MRTGIVWAGLAACLGLVGCDKAGEELEEIRVESACADYCDLKATCDGDFDAESCVDDCEEAVYDCPSEEIDAVVDDLNHCAEQSCDELGECEVGAGLECYFGI